jgi:hypothetical protein
MSDPHSFEDFMQRAFYDELKDEPSTVPDLRVASSSGTRRPAPGFSGSFPRTVGGSAHLESVASLATPPAAVTRDPEAADASPTPGGRGANRTCLCGRVGDPTFPFGYCPGGRECLERILAVDEEAPAAVTSDPGAMAA